MQIVRIGLDLAKYVFEIHGVDAHGKTVVRKTLRLARGLCSVRRPRGCLVSLVNLWRQGPWSNPYGVSATFPMLLRS